MHLIPHSPSPPTRCYRRRHLQKLLHTGWGSRFGKYLVSSGPLTDLSRRYQGEYGRAIFHDETTYGPRTDLFIPERWLTKDGELNIKMRDSTSAFGFGRRICPVRCLLSLRLQSSRTCVLNISGQGRDMAQWSIWICAASILAAFDIRKNVDENGVPIEPSEEYTSGAVWWVLTS